MPEPASRRRGSDNSPYISEAFPRKELRRKASTGMSRKPIPAFTEKQEWLQPIQEKGQALVKDAYRSMGPNARSVKNALHGVWLGHPLHGAITDVPIGSWTTAAVLDLLECGGRSEYAAGADAAVLVGLAGAVGSAATGLTDWSDTEGKYQRLGALHGLLNVGAALLYTGSYIFRKANKRGAGRGLGFAGLGMVLASSYLGGELVYGHRIGVDHSVDRDDLPEEYTKVCNESDLEEGKPSKGTVNGVEIFLLKKDGQIFALGNICSHVGGPLSEGEVKNGTIECPWHGSQFCLTDGSVVSGPATSPQPKLQVEIRNGEVLVRRQQR